MMLLYVTVFYSLELSTKLDVDSTGSFSLSRFRAAKKAKRNRQQNLDTFRDTILRRFFFGITWVIWPDNT